MRNYDGRTTKKLLRDIAKNNPDMYAETANRLKDIGNDHGYEIGFSIGLDDFDVVHREKRDKMIQQAQTEADRVRRGEKDPRKGLKKAIKVLDKMDQELDRLNRAELDKSVTNMALMANSGGLNKREQLLQIVSTPTLMMDAQSRVVPFAIDKSYSEGMDLGSYWTTMHGARKGAVQKVQG